MSHTAEAFAQGTWRMEMEDGPSVMVRKGPRLWVETQSRGSTPVKLLVSLEVAVCSAEFRMESSIG